jgi:alanyl-tRNA synthetase
MPGPSLPVAPPSTSQVLETFRAWYRERGHVLLPSSSLLRPGTDPVLFTTSGMHPLTDDLTRGRHPAGRRLMSVQRCLRTTDIDEVGDDTHLTAFRMLGCWSVGDYPHTTSLRWGYELLTEGFGVPPGLLHATVFGGDDDVPADDDAARLWEGLGVPVERTREDNWWSNGPVGLCGPDSELFVRTGPATAPTSVPTSVPTTPTTDPRWVEVANHVSMRFRRGTDGRLTPLDVPCVDVGAGLERLVAVLQGGASVYDTDVLRPWVTHVSSTWGLGADDVRVVSDHLRACALLVGDGLAPGHTRQGYVLKRLLRRVLTRMWLHDPGLRLDDLPDELVDGTGDLFELAVDPQQVRAVLGGQQRSFERVVADGTRRVDRLRGTGRLGDDVRRELHETYGLPPEVVARLLDPTAQVGGPADRQPGHDPRP